MEEGHYVLENTARREVFEETGIKIKQKMELLVNNIFHHTEDKEPVLAIVFFVNMTRAK
ncbi:NUDIX domain-containing protein [bacterium]|nr:NUDIX domain-containing protein [bacterium]